ncbi:MAG: toll/interleukin-1 receptor domain-containing protein [Ktedonobacteraceae bacterium]
MEIEASPVSIFCGYAHEDKLLFNHLNKHLAVLRSQQYIALWHYGEIPPGAEWELAITRHLDQADIILLLISPSFMDSEYCRGKEMRRAIERHKTGKV